MIRLLDYSLLYTERNKEYVKYCFMLWQLSICAYLAFGLMTSVLFLDQPPKLLCFPPIHVHDSSDLGVSLARLQGPQVVPCNPSTPYERETDSAHGPIHTAH